MTAPNTLEKVSALFDNLAERMEKSIGERVDEATARAVAAKLDEQNQPFEEFKASALAKIEELEKAVEANKARANMVPGLADHPDAKKFSFAKVIRSLVNHSWKGADLERDICAEAQKNTPESVLKGTGLSIDATATGGAIVPEELMTDVIELQRANMVLVQAGARVMSGLTRNPTRIPRLAGGATAYWVGTGGTARDITSSYQSFERIALEQHKVAAATYLDYEMILDSSPAVEGIVREDIALCLANAVDTAGLVGNHSETTYQPDGVAIVAGTNSVAVGTNGGAMTYAIMQNMITEVAVDNALKNKPGWIFHPSARGEIAKLVDGNSRPLFVDLLNSTASTGDGGLKTALVGYPWYQSTNIPIDLTKGGGTDLTYLLFGDWTQMVIGEWGGLVLSATNEGATLALVDQTLVVAKRLVDIGFRHLEAFCVCSDMLATS